MALRYASAACGDALQFFQDDSQVVIDPAETAVQTHIVRVLHDERFLQFQSLTERLLRTGRLPEFDLRHPQVVVTDGQIAAVRHPRRGELHQLTLELDRPAKRSGGLRELSSPGLGRSQVAVGQGQVTAVLQHVGACCGRSLLERQGLVVEFGGSGGLLLRVKTRSDCCRMPPGCEVAPGRRATHSPTPAADGSLRGRTAPPAASRPFRFGAIPGWCGTGPSRRGAVARPGNPPTSSSCSPMASRYTRRASSMEPDRSQQQAEIVPAQGQVPTMLGVAGPGRSQFAQDRLGVPIGGDRVRGGPNLTGDRAHLGVCHRQIGPQLGLVARMFDEAAVVLQACPATAPAGPVRHRGCRPDARPAERQIDLPPGALDGSSPRLLRSSSRALVFSRATKNVLAARPVTTSRQTPATAPTRRRWRRAHLWTRSGIVGGLASVGLPSSTRDKSSANCWAVA